MHEVVFAQTPLQFFLARLSNGCEHRQEAGGALEIRGFEVETATLPSLSQSGKGWWFQLFMLVFMFE